MKKTMSVAVIALVAAWAPLAQADNTEALFNNQMVAAASINPNTISVDPHVSEVQAVASHEDVVKSRNLRPHFKHHFNLNKIDTSGVSADRNAGKKFVYVTHPKHHFKVKRYVGVN
ncbi:hypothetical protein LG201_13145 [Methylobacillus gramineus]|uniref:hypothetical protein n=1 Tax=Methylobacillus gramineus TaxID=755169 RepID=UPI001CFF6B48|nr:hypothetical protein [Methylobacillus gramineus]MCB5186154.1 hypothetical protein [Methylobacillus gramineus]